MKKLLIYSSILLLLFPSKSVFAQPPGRGGFQGDMPKEAKVLGSIVDVSNGQPVPYASIAIYRVRDSSLVTGVMTKEDGSFALEELPYGKFYLAITFVGYKKQNVNNILLTPNQKIATLGAIKVNPLSTALKAVEITGTPPPVEYKIDKKVINIAQNITASGGTLADALQNAPSVQTDVQGNVTIRGNSNFTVLVDGRPSPIAGSEALQQIPANLVQSVEIITNPSAKYEAEGSAGILNIIMKKQKIQGSSGMFNGTAGTGDKYSANVNLNYKVSKFNFTLGGDFTDMQFNVNNFMSNTDTLSSQLLKNETVNGSGNFHRRGMGINAGIDYIIDDKNSLSLTGSMGNRSFSRPISAAYYDEYTSGINRDIFYLNSSNPEFKRDYNTVNLDYLLKLNNNGQQLAASAYFTGGPDNNVSNLLVDTTDANWNKINSKTEINQLSEQNSNETQFRTKVDYTLPMGAKGKLEAGYQGDYFNSKGEYHLKNYGIEDIAQDDKLNYKDQLQAGYVTFSNSMPVVDFQLGLRTEYEDRLLNQEIQDKQFKVNRIDFFPTVHLTRQLPWKIQVQGSYTRRINRPREWNMDPFIVHVDPQTIRQGNAGLLPEFMNSYELNFQKKLTDPSYVSIEGYLKQTDHLIQQISIFDPNTQITNLTFANIDHDRSMGAEFMVYLEPVKWFNLSASVDIYNYHLFGTNIPGVANNTTTWNTRVNPTFHLSKQTTVQISYSYNAPTITAQGKRSGFYFSSLALRQSIMKQKGNLILQVRDLIGHPDFINTTETPHQYRYNRFQRESKVFMLTFSYRINNYRQKTRRNNDENPNSNEGDINGGGME